MSDILNDEFPQPVRDIFEWVFARSRDPETGPGHIVWADQNLEDHWLNSCLAGYTETTCDHHDKTPDEYAAEITGLRRLLDIPEHERGVDVNNPDYVDP